VTGSVNLITARSLFAAPAALVTDGAELLLRVTAQRSAMNNKKLSMMMIFFSTVPIISPRPSK
jgi:hypothetical protein